MRIAVTGADGLFGRRCVEVLSREYPVIPLNHEALDITDMASVVRVLNEVRPDAVVHCAAAPNPDKCEENRDMAYRVNALGTRNVAVACREIGAVLAYISTDYVFDGTKGSPYDEFDTPTPVNHYGKTKHLGELFVKEQVASHFIVRVAWLFDEDFVRGILAQAKAGKPMALVADKFSSPTYTEDAAIALGRLLQTKLYGVYHVVNHGVFSRAGQAAEILSQAGIATDIIREISGMQKTGWIANRPDYTALRPYLIELQGVHRMPTFENAVARCLARIGDA